MFSTLCFLPASGTWNVEFQERKFSQILQGRLKNLVEEAKGIRVTIVVNNKIGNCMNECKFTWYVYTSWLWKFILYTDLNIADAFMMLLLILMFLLLQYSSYVYSFDRSYCAAKTKTSVNKDGDAVVAAFLPLFTVAFDSMSEDPSNENYYSQ